MDKPNFVFILIDDLGWKDLSCYGSQFYETPNLDQLASDGMRFTDAYAACPVCSPTRASILTGKYPATLGLTNFLGGNILGGNTKGKLIDAPYIDHLPLSEKTLATTLRENGYTTWHVGKWHLGGEPYYPEKQGFEVNIGGCDWGLPMHGYFSPWRISTLKDGPRKTYLTDHLTDKAIELIQQNNEKPFFLNMWYYSVHIPIQAKREHIQYYKEKQIDMGLDKGDPFEIGNFFPCEHKKKMRIKRRLIQSDPKYAAMIHSLDENIGRLLQAIDDIGVKDETVVIFTSDNGGLATSEGSPTCNAPLAEGKGWMYEGGTREPLIVKWPKKIQAESQCNVPVTSPDFYPTILELAGLKLLPEQHCDGVSFLPLLKGKASLDREGIFWHYPHYGNQGGTPGSSIRYGDYKLIEFFEDDHVELYNLHRDISEDLDLSENEPAKIEELKALLSNWRDHVKAKIPRPNPDFHLD